MQLNHSGFLGAFQRAPMTTKVAILSRIVSNQPAIAVSKMLDLISAMADCLSLDERIAAVSQVRDVIAALRGQRSESGDQTMQLDEQAALAKEVEHLAAVSNAVSAAFEYDATRIARGLLVIAAVMVENSADPAARVIVAREMIERTRAPDADVVGASLH